MLNITKLKIVTWAQTPKHCDHVAKQSVLHATCNAAPLPVTLSPHPFYHQEVKTMSMTAFKYTTATMAFNVKRGDSKSSAYKTL